MSGARQRKVGATNSARKSPQEKDEPSRSSDDKERMQVFSNNPDKAWAEKWFLAYSPIWPLLFGAWCLSGIHLHAGDAGNLAATLVMASPNAVVPLLFCPTKDRPFYDTYWFKFSIWIWIFTWVASYFFTEYFFDTLGMVYNFPHLSWTIGAELVGRESNKQVVPLMMYFHAWYFFITYHTCSVILIRMLRTAPVMRKFPLIASVVSTVFAAWLFAWGEIFGTTLDAIKEQFRYKDMDWALTWGAVLYSCYFVSSFPMVYGLDEEPGAKNRWSLRRTVESSLAASMIAFQLLDLVVQFVVTGWKEKGFST